MERFIGARTRAARLFTMSLLLAGMAFVSFAPQAGAAVNRSTATGVSAAERASNALRTAEVIANSNGSGQTRLISRMSAVSPHASPQGGDVPCTFDGNSPSVAVTQVTPGDEISISCTQFYPDETVYATEGSPLFISTDSNNDLDPTYQSFTTDSNGDLNGTFTVPQTFGALDPNASCPPTVAQEDAGFLRCLSSSGTAPATGT
jgi:hypothetical protein